MHIFKTSIKLRIFLYSGGGSNFDLKIVCNQIFLLPYTVLRYIYSRFVDLVSFCFVSNTRAGYLFVLKLLDSGFGWILNGFFLKLLHIFDFISYLRGLLSY